MEESELWKSIKLSSLALCVEIDTYYKKLNSKTSLREGVWHGFQRWRNKSLLRMGNRL